MLQIRRYQELGHYKSAAELLDRGLISNGRRLDVALELAEILLKQGYFQQVIAILETHVSAYEYYGDFQKFAAYLIICIARFQCTGLLKNDTQTAEKIYERFRSQEKGSAITTGQFRVEKHYCCLLKFASSYGGLKTDESIVEPLQNILEAFYVFVKRCDWFQALSSATVYQNCSPKSDTILLRELLAENIPELYRGKIQELLAKQMNAEGEITMANELYQNALEIYKDQNHSHGALDVNIKLLCRLPLPEGEPSFEKVISEYLSSYRQLDYPLGLISVLQEVAVFAGSLFAFNVESALFSDIERICGELGSKLLGAVVRLGRLARLAVSGESYGSWKEGAIALWKELETTDCSAVRYQAANLVSQAFYELQDYEKALQWRARAEEEPNTMATLVVLNWPSTLTADELQQKYEVLNREITNHFQSEFAEALFLQIQNFFQQALAVPNDTPEFLDIIENILERGEDLLCTIPRAKDSPVRRARLIQARASVAMKRGSSREDVTAEMRSIELGNEAKKLYLDANLSPEAISVLQQQGLTYIGVFQKFIRWRDPQAKGPLQNAVDLFKVALDSANELGIIRLAKESAYWVAHCQYRQWERGWISYETVLDSLYSAESYVDLHRQELSVLGKIESIHTKRRLATDSHNQQIYHMAKQLCQLNCEPKDVWAWNQKSKARSLSDLLGLGILIPSGLEARIKEDQAAQNLFESEQRILQSLACAAENEQFPMRVELGQVQKEMKSHPTLNELLSLRKGEPVLPKEIHGLLDKAKSLRGSQSMVCIDWMILYDEISLCVIKNTGEIVLRRLSITVEAVKAWVGRNMDKQKNLMPGIGDPRNLPGLRKSDDEDEGPLRELDHLIEPLAELCDKEDLLVLCPSGILHSLPLHALRLSEAGEFVPLIERNRLLYCASHTSFVQCCQSADAENFSESQNSKFLAVYEPTNDLNERAGFDFEEQGQIYVSTKELASQLKGKCLVGREVDHDAMTESFETSKYIHFIGHSNLSSQSMAEQSLEISAKSIINVPFSITDVFNLRMKARVVTLLGCSTANQQFAVGDEPLGLVSAFLSNGASSVIGTLWPVESPTARKFASRFYAYVQEAADRGTNLYDLASIVREAVLDLKYERSTRHPYHWAPFILYGAWFYKGEI